MATKEFLRRPAPSRTGPARLLVVSREPAALTSLWAVGELHGWEMELTGSGCEALERVQSEHAPDLVILDLARGDADGLYTLRWLRRVQPDAPVILLAHADDASQKVEAIRLGARDFLLRPIDEHVLEAVMRRHLALSGDTSDGESASETVEPLGDDMFFIAASPIMRKLRTQAELLAQVDVPVLIVGESGSGKEATARLIHKLSVRSGFRFRKVNCEALPGDLLERELFGYEAGAFPGAQRATEGSFELAQKGTVLLDDVTETPYNLQIKLLQTLQEKQFTRMGGQSRIGVDVRMIATANGSLDRALSEKKLREDFYYRLSAFTVHVPPLRQRGEEIPLLLGHSMNQMARRYGLPARPFSAAVLQACQSHLWPGNLRELEAFVKRYLVMGDDEDLVLRELGRGWDTAAEPGITLHASDASRREFSEEPEEPGSGLRSLVQSVKGEAERNAIAGALQQTHWNRKAAARLLQVSYRTLLYKIQQYQLSPPPAYLSSAWMGQGVKGNSNGR